MTYIEELKLMTFDEILEHFILINIKKEQLINIINDLKIPIDKDRKSIHYLKNRVANWLCISG